MGKKIVAENRLIVKVQVSIVSSDALSKYLIYNEDASIMCEVPKKPGEALLAEDELKAYFYAHFDEDYPDMIVIDERAPWQDW